MRIGVLEIKTITASEGMVLTDGKTFSDAGATIYLGVGDSPDNWREITQEEAEELSKEEAEPYE